MSQYDILIVEDESDLREVLQAFLIAENLSVLEAEDGQAALDLLNAGAQPTIAICDISMPRMDGLEFIGQALRVQPTLGVILLTGHDDSEKIREALRLGAIDYLLKPFRHEELLERVYRSIAISNLRQAQVEESPTSKNAIRKETLMRIRNTKPRAS